MSEERGNVQLPEVSDEESEKLAKAASQRIQELESARSNYNFYDAQVDVMRFMYQILDPDDTRSGCIEMRLYKKVLNLTKVGHVDPLGRYIPDAFGEELFHLIVKAFQDVLTKHLDIARRERTKYLHLMGVLPTVTTERQPRKVTVRESNDG